ncbi:HK97 gp10 family phage protein [Variovorax sp. H27-G14]|uniref:HK97 gp10 family phage protein n=1 Tax=Variovorax sp. H27-G14 TaxID=3111914 RepID=UPI0038FCDF40
MTTLRSRNGKHALTGKNSFSIDADTSGLDAYLDTLGDAVEEAVRPAAQAGAQVLYERVRMNVAALGAKTGNLARSIYQVYSTTESANAKATYHVSWNHRTAPHGHLVEYGYLQRYRYYKGGDGAIRPMVRPGMEGRRKPGRRASASEKAAYYVTLPTPIQVPGKAFVRSAEAAMEQAIKAAEIELFRRINEGAKLA